MDSASWNIYQEKRSLQNLIVEIAVNNGGIVYGSYVSNNFIIDYYSDKFNSVKRGQYDYWNKMIGSETFELRTLVHDILDIMFQKKYDYKLFIKALQDKYISNEFEEGLEFYIDSELVKKEFYNLSKPIVMTAHKTQHTKTIVSIIINSKLPPVYIDINMFVCSNSGISLRKNTDIKSFDNLNDYNKMIIMPKIINGIINKKINVLLLNEKSLKEMGTLIKNNYEVINLPFITHSNYKKQCAICFENDKATIKLNNSYLCKDCMHLYTNTICIYEENNKRFIKDTNNSKIFIQWEYPIKTDK